MNIYPSAAIRQNYNKIADLCRRTGQPVFLTKKGKGDLVVLDIDSWERERQAFEEEKHAAMIRESLLQAEAEIARGEYCTLDETLTEMKKIIEAAEGTGVTSDEETA